jgi:hypothetical protein
MKSSASAGVAEPLPDREELLARARGWEQKLLGGPITYFPVRHHSPACARILAEWIDEVRPESIIVEGPCSLDQWLSALVSEQCVGPIAVLTTYQESAEPTSLRHSAFFPLCDYSPEWVAIRQGSTLGARVRFADLEFADRVRLRKRDLDESESPRSMLGVLLADESHLRYSQFIDLLVRRLGCRDFDELWDHLFESRSGETPAGTFVGTLATYCDLSRASYEPGFLKSDATLAREAAMVEVIRAEFKRLKKPKRRGALLVLTGGFHTVALPDLVAGKKNPDLETLDPLAPELTGNWLIRYSYLQLDSLAGYRSGMPSPGFYDALWQAERQAIPPRRAVARLISTIARETRGKPLPHESSVTDSIAAMRMADQLAELRGHAAPTRADLLDAIGSCMRKETNANDLLAQIVRRVLAGDRIGTVPPSAGLPPIVDDFHQRAKSHRLPINTIEPRGVTLELYRKPAHRPISFFLHQLQLLDVPYASFVDGPDFIHGHRLEKLQEEWQAAWNPSTEARLAELAQLSDTVAGAAAQRLLQRIAEFDEQGAARSAAAAVELLIRTCRCGLHVHVEQILQTVQQQAAEDASFASVAGGLSRLTLLVSAREPLEATRLERLGEVVGQFFRRACYLAGSLAEVPDDQLDASLDGLLSIRELLSAQAIEAEPSPDECGAGGSLALDANLFLDAMASLVRDTGKPARSEIAGAAAGLLHASGRIDQQQVCTIVKRYLDAAVDDVGKACGVVRGLVMTAREAFWRMDELLRGIDDLFRAWEENRFNNALPHMRLAFSQLSPREIDSVAGRVASLHQVAEIGPLIHPDVAEEEMRLGVKIAELMNRSLREDGLL